MAYDIPTAAQLKARYPAFETVADDTVDIHITDAAASGVDQSWLETDYTKAVSALAAHFMATLGLEAVGEVEGYARQGLVGLKSGNFDVKINADKAKAASGGGFDATVYGQQHETLLQKNKGGPRIIRGRTADAGLDPWAY